MIPKPICILVQSPKPTMQSHTTLSGLRNHPLDLDQFYLLFICVRRSSEAGYQKADLVSGFNKSGIASLLPGKSMLPEVCLLTKRHA